MGFLDDFRKSLSSTNSMEYVLKNLSCLKGFTVDQFDTNCFNVFGNSFYYDVMGENSTIGVFYEGRKLSTTIAFAQGNYGDVDRINSIMKEKGWDRKYNAEATEDSHGNLASFEWPEQVGVLDLEDALKGLMPLPIQLLYELKSIAPVQKTSDENSYDDELEEILRNEPNLKGFRIDCVGSNEFALHSNYLFYKAFGDEYHITFAYHKNHLSLELETENSKGSPQKAQNTCLLFGYGITYNVSISGGDNEPLRILMKTRTEIPIERIKDTLHELSTAFMMVLRDQK